MYQLVRRIHLYCGLVVLAFLTMYFVSGYMMAHRPWFLGPSPAPTTRTVAFQPTADVPAETLAGEVKERLGLPGRIQFPAKQPAGMTRFWVNRPGWMVRVDVPAGEPLVHVTTQRTGLVGTLIMLHKVRGYDGQLVFDACALFCDLSGLSMIVFAVSGVYLWWKRVKNHAWGIVCLTASCAYAVGMMIYFAYAP